MDKVEKIEKLRGLVHEDLWINRGEYTGYVKAVGKDSITFETYDLETITIPLDDVDSFDLRCSPEWG